MKIIKNWTKWIYWLTLGIAIIFIYKTVDSFDNISLSLGKFFIILRPVFWGVLLAYLFYIPCRAVERLYKKVKILNRPARLLSILTVYLITLLFIVLLMNIVFPSISKSVMDLANNLPTYYNNAISFINNDIPEDWIISKDMIEGMINHLQKIDITEFFSMESINNYINRAIGVVNAFFGIFMAVITSIYVLLERTKIKQFINKVSEALFKENTSRAIDKYFDEGNELFFKYIYSQIVDSLIIGIISAIILWIMGVKYAVLLAIVVAVLNIIPVIGSIISTIIVGLVAFIVGDPSQAFWVLIIFTILQQIDGNIIRPKLIDSILNVSPVVTLVTITIAGAYYGMIGMFLAVPVVALFKIMLDDFLEYKIENKEREVIQEQIEEIPIEE